MIRSQYSWLWVPPKPSTSECQRKKWGKVMIYLVLDSGSNLLTKTITDRGRIRHPVRDPPQRGSEGSGKRFPYAQTLTRILSA